MQNQQYTSNYQHQHPPHLSQHQISLYNGSNQFEQQHLPPTQQQQNINFIHAVSSAQQHPFRGDDGLSAGVVRRQKRPPIAIGKSLNKMITKNPVSQSVPMIHLTKFELKKSYNLSPAL